MNKIIHTTIVILLIAIATLLIVISSNAQTIEQRLDRIEDSLHINWNVVIVNDSLPQPIYEGIVMVNTTDQYIFNPAIYSNGYSNLYCIKNNAEIGRAHV